jgi:hypothetical protein
MTGRMLLMYPAVTLDVDTYQGMASAYGVKMSCYNSRSCNPHGEVPRIRACLSTAVLEKLLC